MTISPNLLTSARAFAEQTVNLAGKAAEGAIDGFGLSFVLSLDYLSTPDYTDRSLTTKAMLLVPLAGAVALATVAGGIGGVAREIFRR